MTLPAPDGFPTARLLLPTTSSHEEWEAARRTGIASSDVAAILGVDPHKGPLHVWEEKHGRGVRRDTEAMECARELKDPVARLFSRRAGLPVASAPQTLVHIERDWQIASIRYFAVDGDQFSLLACKSRSEYQAKDWETAAPQDSVLQCLWQLATIGYDHGYVAALIGGNRLRWHRIERDEDKIAHLIDYCGHWWLQHIVEGTPPAPDGSKATTDLIAHLWTGETDSTKEVDPVLSSLLLERHHILKSRMSVDTDELDEVENQMKALLGTAEIATVDGLPIYSWPQNGQFAYARFREAEPELAAEYSHQVPAIDSARLASERPELHRKYRARVLHVLSEG